MAELSGEAWHREQRRRSQDLIRVVNPTDKDYVLLWDEGGASAKFIVPNKDKDMGFGKGMRVMQRYLAQKYTREMVDKLILEKGDTILQEWKDKLAKQGATAIEHNANQQLLGTKYMRSDDTGVRQPFEDMIWLGIEEEFGLDQEILEKPAQVDINTDPFDRLKDKRYVQPSNQGAEITTEADKPQRGRPAVKHDLSDVAQ